MSVADPRCHVRLEEPIPGIDHIKFIDPRKLAEAHGGIDGVAGQLGVATINDFYMHSSGSRLSAGGPWHPASEGLAAFRAVREAIERRASAADASPGSSETLEVLARLEELLGRAEARGVRFCIVGNY